MRRFKDKYRRTTFRAQWWNYANNAAYFITICTKSRIHYFGEIIAGKQVLTEGGKIAENVLLQMQKMYPFAILDCYVIMPNHIHCIILINHDVVKVRLIAPPQDAPEAEYPPVKARLIAPPQEDVPPHEAVKGGFIGDKNPMLHNNISRVIRWYKGRTTYEIRKIIEEFAWQSLFHDHIIRDQQAYLRISNYIYLNPVNWKEDIFFK